MNTFSLNGASNCTSCKPRFFSRENSIACARESRSALSKGGVAGVTFTLLLVCGAGLLLVVRFRKTKKYLALSEALLQEAQDEVGHLKEIWEIDPEEIQLLRRIDLDSPGAFGEVWLGIWRGFQVAVKKLKVSSQETSTDPFASEDFKREADFMMGVKHANVVMFFGAGIKRECFHDDGTACDLDHSNSATVDVEVSLRAHYHQAIEGDDGVELLLGGESSRPKSICTAQTFFRDVPFIVTEFVAHGSLSSLLRAEGAIPNSLKLSLARNVADGMSYIHSTNHLHRDLKTGNILITDSLVAKVADFGTIQSPFHDQIRGYDTKHNDRASVSSEASSSKIDFSLTAGVGTPIYMAPEVIEGGHYTLSADVWSFGVVLWEIATRRRPDLFAELSLPPPRGPFLATLKRHFDEGKRLPRPESHECSERTVSLILSCFSGEPFLRPTFANLSSYLTSISEF